MPAIIRPATLAFDPSGTPFSEKFGDVYHSEGSGPEQARHVFVQGNDLPSRWAGRRVFTIVETGFGLGLNFMATGAAWRLDPNRCQRLHFVSVERHPFVGEDLATLHARYPEFREQSAEICAAWPLAIAGVHRLHLDHGRITLTLFFGDVVEALRGMRFGADAFYLDGFAPDRNPEMWSPAVMKALARLARPGATLATYSTARAVRDALAAAGFVVGKSKGHGRKREMLTGRFAPRWSIRHPSPPPVEATERCALVIGAGLAGAAIAERLASRGWQATVLDRNTVAAGGASGLYAGVLQPHLSRDDCLLSRVTRAGFLYAHSRRRSINADDPDPARPPCGVLQIADDARHEARMADDLAALAYPATYAQLVTHDQASALAGRRLSAGGWWIPMGDWARPAALVRAQLTAAEGPTPPPRMTLGRDVAALRRAGGRWHAIDACGDEIADAPVVVLANANGAGRWFDLESSQLHQVAGQLTLFAAPACAPRAVVCGRGYVLPDIGGYVVAGASYDPAADDTTEVDDVRHAANLRRAERLLPGITADLDPATLKGEVGVRCVARDRLPMVGPVVNLSRAREIEQTLSGAHASDMPRLPGLYCAIAFASRGLAWTALAAECLASQLEGEPLPLEAAIVDAVDPGRFAVRHARRGTL